MNLGLGAGSKKGSIIDVVKEDVSSTPRQQRPPASKITSVSDVLGLNDDPSRDSYHSSSNSIVTSIPDIPDHHITPFAYNSSSSSSSPSPSPPLPSHSLDTLHSTTPPSHSEDVFSSSSRNSTINNQKNGNSAYPSSTSEVISPVPSRHSHRRPLSKVVERPQENEPSDPMSGDWNVPLYGQLSPNHIGNGRDSYYSSGEER